MRPLDSIIANAPLVADFIDSIDPKRTHEKVSPTSPHNPVFTLMQLRTRSLLRIVLLLPPKEVPIDVPLYVPGVGPRLSPNVE
jgi:hypothetical protein